MPSVGDGLECLYCGHAFTVMASNMNSAAVPFLEPPARATRAVVLTVVRCPRAECHREMVTVELQPFGARILPGGSMAGPEGGRKWFLIPPSSARVFPDYVPEAIRQDYSEACAILSLSPKASATLARRCVQGMIRDFWGIKNQRTLADEIRECETKSLLEGPVIRGLTSLRRVANIGAHMEQDVNMIVDVEPREAELLLKFVELLLTEWYVRRHDRDELLREMDELGETKAPGRKPEA